MLRALSTAVFALCAACYSPSPADCAYRCGMSNACPAGYACEQGFCRSPTAGSATCEPIDAAPGSDALSDAPPGSPLVAWYAMETLSNGTLADTSGNGHVGQCSVAMNTCPQLVTGVSGMGLRFDGLDDIIVIPSAPAFETPQGYTATAWIYIDAAPTAITCFVGKGYTAATNSWQICMQPGREAVHVTEGEDLYNGPAVPLGGWHHIAVRWDANGMEKTTWLDGVLKWTNARSSVNFDTESIRIGADINFNATADPLNGILDEVRIYSRPLTSAEIDDLATP